MEQSEIQQTFKDISASCQDETWTFKDILDIAKNIKLPGWVVVTNKRRLSFMEVCLGQQGPASILKQLVVDDTLKVEAFIDGEKFVLFNMARICSPTDLFVCLNVFSNYGVCQGNHNFKRINKEGEIQATDYWRDTKCQKVYNKTLRRPESCCDACLKLNEWLPKKINNTYLRLRQPDFNKLIVKNHTLTNTELIKTEKQRSGKRKKVDVDDITKEVKGSCIETHFVAVKEEHFPEEV